VTTLVFELWNNSNGIDITASKVCFSNSLSDKGGVRPLYDSGIRLGLPWGTGD
jgi:hypothetical protein